MRLTAPSEAAHQPQAATLTTRFPPFRTLRSRPQDEADRQRDAGPPLLRPLQTLHGAPREEEKREGGLITRCYCAVNFPSQVLNQLCNQKKILISTGRNDGTPCEAESVLHIRSNQDF